ncbi:MAG: hypothetical protein QF666_01300 [Alphaproteobacteria bacterium]|nr:hypothetical protein [Alphaproteobacteria bacterium]
MHRAQHNAVFERDTLGHQLGGDFLELVERHRLGLFLGAFREIMADQIHAVAGQHGHDVEHATGGPAQFAGGGQGFFPG